MSERFDAKSGREDEIRKKFYSLLYNIGYQDCIHLGYNSISINPEFELNEEVWNHIQLVSRDGKSVIEPEGETDIDRMRTVLAYAQERDIRKDDPTNADGTQYQPVRIFCFNKDESVKELQGIDEEGNIDYRTLDRSELDPGNVREKPSINPVKKFLCQVTGGFLFRDYMRRKNEEEFEYNAYLNAKPFLKAKDAFEEGEERAREESRIVGSEKREQITLQGLSNEKKNTTYVERSTSVSIGRETFEMPEMPSAGKGKSK